MAGKKTTHLDNQSQLFGQCTLIQAKIIITAFQQLLHIVNGKTNTPRKPVTSRRPHPTYSHRTSSPRAYQINHLTHKSSCSRTELNLPTDFASHGHTSFHTMLQMITKQGWKPLPVKIDSGAEINMVPLSKYKKLFPAHVTKSGKLKSNALHPTTKPHGLHMISPHKSF